MEYRLDTVPYEHAVRVLYMVVQVNGGLNTPNNPSEGSMKNCALDVNMRRGEAEVFASIDKLAPFITVLVIQINCGSMRSAMRCLE